MAWLRIVSRPENTIAAVQSAVLVHNELSRRYETTCRITLKAASEPSITSFNAKALRVTGALFELSVSASAILQLKVPGIVTTYITGTWTNLINGLVHFRTWTRQSSRAKEREFEARFAMQAGVLAAYFLSAVLTGWLFQHSPRVVGMLPALSVLIVALYGMART